MTEPVLSVTVANYNYAHYLPQSIESILNQTFEDFELVIIDNASTDNSAELIREFEARDQRVRSIIHPQNEGVVFSYREAASTSRGKYRVHVEADDWVIDPKAFERQVALLEEHPSMSFCYPALTMVDARGDVIHVTHAFDGDAVLRGEQTLESLLNLKFTHTGMMMRLDSYRATEGYQERFPHTTDTMLAIRLAEVGDVGYLDQSLYAFRQHGSNLHRRDESGLVEGEYFPMIAAAFEGPLGARLRDPEAVRRRVERRALVHLPTQHISRGDVRTGWWLYWTSVRLRPLRTVAQAATLHLLARTLLGARRFEQLRGRFGSQKDERARSGTVDQ